METKYNKRKEMKKVKWKKSQKYKDKNCINNGFANPLQVQEQKGEQQKKQVEVKVMS